MKFIFAKTVNYTTDIPVELHIFDADSEFRKIEDDVKNNVFNEFKISIRRMGKNQNLPTFMLNTDNDE